MKVRISNKFNKRIGKFDAISFCKNFISIPFVFFLLFLFIFSFLFESVRIVTRSISRALLRNNLSERALKLFITIERCPKIELLAGIIMPARRLRRQQSIAVARVELDVVSTYINRHKSKCLLRFTAVFISLVRFNQFFSIGLIF